MVAQQGQSAAASCKRSCPPAASSGRAPWAGPGCAPRRAPLRSAALPQGLSGGGGVTRADTRAGIAPPCRLAAATGPFKIAVSLSFPPRLPSLSLCLSSSFCLPGAGLAAGRAFPELAPAVLSQTAPGSRPRGPAAPRGCSPRLAPTAAAGGRQERGSSLPAAPARGWACAPPARRWISYTQLAQVRGALQTRAGGGDPDAGSSRENMQPFWAEADKEPPAAAAAPAAPRGSRTPRTRGAAAPKGRNPRPPAAAGGPPPPPDSQLSDRSHLHGLL